MNQLTIFDSFDLHIKEKYDNLCIQIYNFYLEK